MAGSPFMCGLEAGKFYADMKSGSLYYADTNRVVALPSGTRLNPTKNPHHGLSSLHDDEIDVRNFQEVDLLRYLENRVDSLIHLIVAVKGLVHNKDYSPKLTEKQRQSLDRLVLRPYR